MLNETKFYTLQVSGTHCRSCEILIEKEISKLPGVNSVSASTKDQRVIFEYQKNKPDISQLNKIFKDSGYHFSNNLSQKSPQTDIFTSLLIAIGILVAFYFIQKLSIFSSFQINESSLSPSFFVFGLLAGFSTCAALVGGIILSLSRQWNNLYSRSDSVFHQLQPVLMFNLGRLVFFSFFGAFLGYFGSFFRLSLTVGAVVAILVSVLMLVLGLQMLGVKALSSFQLTLPKSLSQKFADETQFQGRFMPLLMGGFTFFLPCGFTLTAQSLALASGSPLRGALIMFFFSLGTFIPLFLIGYSSVKSSTNPVTSKYFSQVAGILVILFALFNFKSQLNVLGVGASPTKNYPISTTIPIINGKQVLKMAATSSGYTPNAFTVKAGQLIRWEITDRGTSGCTNAVISRTLFDGPINLVPGTTSVKEFTAPTTPGTYRFSCWMGMISGTITVVE
jgi:uncharacterized protein